MTRDDDHRCVFAFKVQCTAGGVGHAPPGLHTAMVHTGRSAGTLHFADSRRRPFCPDQIFIYDSREDFTVHTARPGTHTCLGIAGRYATQLTPTVLDVTEPMADLVSRIDRAMTDEPDPFRSDRLDMLVGLLAVEILADRAEPGPSRADDLAQAAREIMDHQFAKLSGPGELARRLCVSREYLRQLFHRRYGTAPLEYLLARRVDAAGQMLRFSDLPVGLIGRRCGFESPYYFSRLFKKRTGAAPSHWRRKNRTGDLHDR
jgi:AraC-like DNA-binding protein